MTSAMTSPSSPPAHERPEISLKSVVLDTDDPADLARFYMALLGWHIRWAEEDWVSIIGGGDVAIAFQLVLNYRPPTWPDEAVPQQLHFDLRVRDLPTAAAYAESIGARPVGEPDESAGFRVFLDPSGHPFCLTANEVVDSLSS
jgi:predicted enzyme related to lactoylglutathione lyase